MKKPRVQARARVCIRVTPHHQGNLFISLLATSGWKFTIEPVWLPKYASWLDQIEIWFSILQRKLLTPNDFPNKETLRQRLMEFIVRHNAERQTDQLVVHCGANDRQIRHEFMKFCTKSGRILIAGDHTVWSRPDARTLQERTIQP